MSEKKYDGKLLHSAFRFQHWQKVTIMLAIYDIFAVTVPYFLALWLRFDCYISQVPDYYIESWLKFAPFYAAACVIVFSLLKLYRSIWRFASYHELVLCILATAVTGIIHVAGTLIFLMRMPVSYYCMGILFQFILVVGIRFAYRFVLLLRNKQGRIYTKKVSRVAIVGAGSAGRIVLRDVQKSSTLNEKVFCFIDDNKNKWGRNIDGVPVVGGREEIPSAVQRYNINKIYIAIADTSAKNKKDIIEICTQTGCEIKNLPGVYQLASGEVSLKEMRDISIEDLLGRESVETNLDEVFKFISGKRVLVTGGGGSIGSELCRQIASHKPEKLIVFDIYENNAYDIQQELLRNQPDLNLTVLIGSVRDSARIRAVMREYAPEIVFHAAAHKHVPLMEDSPAEAVKNNTLGTYKTALAAAESGVKKFVLISTDKAVNPTNIMGASKRMCEMVIQMMDRQTPDTDFIAVRFGNVLGSNGSVVPLFRKQIAQGGPVTVTDKNIIRYFMTIPEAVSLVLQASCYAKGGEIFVLDMGEPVKIDDMARNLIRLSGYVPDVDIPIIYTGLRPGEKLYEELLMDEEGLTGTANNLIYIGHPIAMDDAWFEKKLQELDMAACTDLDQIRELVAEIVPTYRYGNQEEVQKQAAE